MTEAHAELDTLIPSRSASPGLAAEPAVHGEHPVIRLPFNVVINGRSFQGHALSIVGAEATGLIDPQLHGRVQLVTLVFNFPGYAISLLVLGSIYPTTALVVLTRPGVKAACLPKEPSW